MNRAFKQYLNPMPTVNTPLMLLDYWINNGESLVAKLQEVLHHFDNSGINTNQEIIFRVNCLKSHPFQMQPAKFTEGFRANRMTLIILCDLECLSVQPKALPNKVD